MDLRVAEQLASYSGAILFYRRTKDEIITTEMRNLATNRVNDLVLHTVRHRLLHKSHKVTQHIAFFEFFPHSYSASK